MGHLGTCTFRVHAHTNPRMPDVGGPPCQASTKACRPAPALAHCTQHACICKCCCLGACGRGHQCFRGLLLCASHTCKRVELLTRRSFTHTLCKLQDPCCVQFPRPFKRERPQTSNAKIAVSRSSDVPRLIDLSHCASERTTQDQSTTLAFGQYGTRATKSLDTCSLAASPNGRLQQL